MDWMLIVLAVCVGFLVIVGVLYMIDTVGIDLLVGDARVVGRNYTPPREEFDTQWFLLTKMWRNKTVPASWHLLLEIYDERVWIEVSEATYRYRDGAVFKVWFGRRRLTGRILVRDFYNE